MIFRYCTTYAFIGKILATATTAFAIITFLGSTKFSFASCYAPVRIDDGHDVHVVVVEDVGVRVVVLDEPVRQEEDSGGADPLAGVDAPIHPDRGLPTAGGRGATDLEHAQRTVLVGTADRNHLRQKSGRHE